MEGDNRKCMVGSQVNPLEMAVQTMGDWESGAVIVRLDVYCGRLFECQVVWSCDLG